MLTLILTSEQEPTPKNLESEQESTPQKWNLNKDPLATIRVSEKESTP